MIDGWTYGVIFYARAILSFRDGYKIIEMHVQTSAHTQTLFSETNRH